MHLLYSKTCLCIVQIDVGDLSMRDRLNGLYAHGQPQVVSYLYLYMIRGRVVYFHIHLNVRRSLVNLDWKCFMACSSRNLGTTTVTTRCTRSA